MSGHSKWARIHRQKGVTDAKRGILFTKLGNAITIVAREGGDPSANFKLRLAIEQAKNVNMPKENIERAIKRGTGEIAGVLLENVTYEGFGPAQTGWIIECVTDNRNRTGAAIKHIFTKHGGALAGPNSVMWMFERKGSIGLKNINDEMELKLIDAGAMDIEKDNESATVYCQPNNLHKIKAVLEASGIKVEFAENDLVPKERKPVGREDKKKIEAFIEELEDEQDMKDFYTNAIL